MRDGCQFLLHVSEMCFDVLERAHDRATVCPRFRRESSGFKQAAEDPNDFLGRNLSPGLIPPV